MKKNTLQYTIRNIPLHIDKILRQRAKDTKKSFNQIVLEAILAGAGEGQQDQMPKRDLSMIEGTMRPNEANQLEKEIKRQRQIDKDLWK